MCTYDDEYRTCAGTDAMLRIFSDTHSPEFITRAIGVEPTHARMQGVIRVPDRPETINKTNSWLLNSKNFVSSKDNRRHVDWILSQLEGREKAVEQLREEGASIDVGCTWESAEQQGGPTLDPRQLEGLVKFKLSIWWEIYFIGLEESDNKSFKADAVNGAA